MGKIKNWFHNQQSVLAGVVRKYLVTLILVLLLCIFYDYLDISDITITPNLEYILVFLGMAIVGTFFTESVLRGRKSREAAITGYIFSGLGAFLWVIIDVISRSEISNITQYYFVAFAVLYVLVLLGLSLLALQADSGLTFEKYLLRLVMSVLKLLLILFILNAGVLFILWLFDTLITRIYIYRWLGHLEIVLAGLIYVPYALSCLTDKSEPEQTKFAKGVVLYALMPILIAAMVIIYIYMIRLLVTQSIPSNQIYMICAVLFCVGVVIWTMAYAYTRRNVSTIYHKIIRYMKYFYAPFILLETYAMGVRINENGWTILRYAGIMFIVFQVIYVAWEPLVNLFRLIFRKKRIHYNEHYEWMIYVVFGLYIIATIIPWTSAEYVESTSQEARFVENWNQMLKLRELNRKLTPDEYQELAKVQYSGRSMRLLLENNIYGQNFLIMNYKESELDQMFSMDSPLWALGEDTAEPVQRPSEELNENEYLSGGVSIKIYGISVESYTRLYEATLHSAYETPLDWSDLSGIELGYGQDQVISVDMTSCIEAMIKENEASKKVQESTEETTESEPGSTETTEVYDESKDTVYRIPVQDGVYVITQISFRYNSEMKQIRNLSLNGFLLFP